MNKTKALMKNTLILMIGKISSQMINFLLLPIYTAKLSTAEYGEIDIYVSLLMIITPLITLQVEQGLFRYVIITQDKETRTKYISSAFVILLFMSLLYLLIFYEAYKCMRINYAVYLFWYYFSYCLYIVSLQVCRGIADNWLYSISSFLNTFVIILLSIFLILILNMRVDGVLIANITGNILISIIVFYKTKIAKYIRIQKKYLDKIKELLLYSVPLIFNQISSWVINYSDRLIILFYIGIDANGIYSVSNKFSTVLISFFGIYNLAWTESVAGSVDKKEKDTFVSDAVRKTFELYGLLTIWVIAILSFIFKYLVNQEYYDAYNYVPILVLSACFSGMAATIGSIFIAYKKTINVAITTIIASLVNIVIHIFLIKKIGLYASAISTLISFITLLTYRIINIRKYQRLVFNISILCKLMIIFAIEYAVYLSNNKYVKVLGILLLSVYSLVYLKRNGKDFISILKK